MESSKVFKLDSPLPNWLLATSCSDKIRLPAASCSGEWNLTAALCSGEILPGIFLFTPRKIWLPFTPHKIDSPLHDVAVSPMHLAAVRSDSLIQVAAGSHISPLQNAAGRFDPSLYDAAGRFDSPLHDAAGRFLQKLSNWLPNATCTARFDSPLQYVVLRFDSPLHNAAERFDCMMQWVVKLQFK